MVCAKLEFLGVHLKFVAWMTSFLASTALKVKPDSPLSDKAPVPSGVRQGSVIDPLQCFVMINDLPEVVSPVCFLFADWRKIRAEMGHPSWLLCCGCLGSLNGMLLNTSKGQYLQVDGLPFYARKNSFPHNKKTTLICGGSNGTRGTALIVTTLSIFKLRLEWAWNSTLPDLIWP